MRTTKGGFTLIELLVVIAIIAILVALSASGMRNDPAVSLGHAGDKVVLLAQQARQIAKAHRSLTALALVTNSNNEDWDYRLMGILEILPGESAWRMISRWESLPAGVSIDPTESVPFAQSPSPKIPFPSLKRSGVSIPSSSYVCQIFLPSGQLLQQSPIPSICLRMTNGNTANFYKVILSSTTGTIVVERP